jgi:CRP/FNR family cyclic AMP-dependent transcriptional regulator
VIQEFLRTVPLFRELDDDELAQVLMVGLVKRYPEGTAILVEGESGGQLHVISEGEVRISKVVPGVGEEALTILDAGAYFGEMAMIDDAPRSADALAHTPCTLAVIRRDDLDQLMFVDKELAYLLLWTFVRTLSARLRETNDKIQGFFAMTGPFR